MEPTISFAPLAARLAAHAAAIRPVDGTRDDWSNVGALLVCLLLEFLIAMCEALDARAAAEAAGTMAAPSPRKRETTAVSSPRSASQAVPYGLRARRLALAPEAQAISPDQADAAFGIIRRFAPAGPWLVWSRDPGPIRAVHAPPWRPRRETRLLRLQSNTPLVLRCRN